MKRTGQLLALLLAASLGSAGALAAPMSAGELAEFLIWNIDEPKPAEQRFREALKAHADPSAEAAQINTQLARSLGLQMRFDEGHALLDKIEPRLAGLPPVVKVRYLLERGRLFNSNKAADKALPLFVQAWELAVASKLPYLAVDSAHMAGIAAQGDAAVEWNSMAIAYAEASPDPAAKRWLASLYNNQGYAFESRKQYDKALELYQKALAERQKQAKPGAIRIAKWMIAHVQRLTGKLDPALATQKALEDEMTAAKDVDGYVYEELAELYLAKGDKAQARRYFGLAYAELSKDAFLVRDEATRLARIKQLSEGS
ncbi:tetratricopeptide repeat protein [Parachitinimonas caeni]|uniref:Tetratricopeptide repeat protein n=1 Tax=Parachitinimonas caeni TaxID=3031301 RepID=A0ABT7DUU4_9NEIS|nr:tetratricopeptide repeat protein [Parachitinimonas caeni]MDK2123843.1 tetratricopeptide repeat protein [Parachitinimonas caeni]